MPKTNQEGYWITARGRAVHPDAVDPVNKKRDKLVERIHNHAEKLHERMKKDKVKFMRWIDDYIAWLEKHEGAEMEGKGNVTLSSFSGDMSVQIAMNDVIEFDERLQLGKALIDKCLHRLTEGADPALKTLITEAFEVDKKGKINAAKVLRLRSIKLNDDEWIEAMRLISDSVQIAATSQYLLLKKRDDKGKMQRVSLNFSSL